ncbi:hypothetical protein LEMLEM_LOCUS24348 [Lemmus lemmus]
MFLWSWVRDKDASFPGSGLTSRVCFFPWLRSHIQGVFLSLALGSESGCLVIGFLLQLSLLPHTG